jgi:hypothetical protein
MQFMTINGGLYRILNKRSDESTMTYILWPVDEKARTDYEAREAKASRHARPHKQGRNR